MDDIRGAIREEYGRIGASGAGCCGASSEQDSGCGCGPSGSDQRAGQLGYSDEQLASLPEGANLGLGCGNPQGTAALKPGEVVLDLGAGAGIDCFLAARQVGDTGKVIGVDMTPEMVSRARANAERGSVANVEFRLGEIEHLPVADGSVDVILSNCVINLSPDKLAVYREAYRVLRPGGRLAITDVATTQPLPDDVRKDARLLVGCVAGAATIADLRRFLADAGFANIRVTPIDGSSTLIREWAPQSGADGELLSASIEATRP